MARLVISCPSCGAPNASTVATCVQCGANLKPEVVTEPIPPPMPGGSDAQSSSPGYQANAAPPPQQSAQVPLTRSFVSQPKAVAKGGIARLGSQAIFYMGCAILIVIPVLLIGLGPLRVMLARIFQH